MAMATEMPNASSTVMTSIAFCGVCAQGSEAQHILVCLRCLGELATPDCKKCTAPWEDGGECMWPWAACAEGHEVKGCHANWRRALGAFTAAYGKQA